MAHRRGFAFPARFSKLLHLPLRRRRLIAALVVAALLVGLLLAALAFAVTHPPAVTGLTSSTHPVEATWYGNADPAFAWNAAAATDAAVSGYSYWLDQNASSSDSTPGIDLDAFGFAAAASYTCAAEPYSNAVGDLNADGKPDLVTANAAVGVNSVSVLLGSGDGTFAAKQDFTVGTDPQEVAVGDFDSDGKLDLVTADYGISKVSVLRNTTTNGSATLSFAAKADFTAGTGCGGVCVADLDGDGKLDVVTANNDTITISVLRNTSSGVGNISFAAKQDFAVGTYPYTAVAADFDGDGKRDLAAVNNGSNSVSVLRNTSSGAGNIGFAAKVDVATAAGPYSAVAADLNGDGKADLAIPCETANKVSVLRNTSSGAGNIGFATKVDYTTGTAPWDAVATDLNGDGKADLAVANSGATFVSVLPGNGDATFAAKKDYATGAGTAPSAVDSADFNGDGKPDLTASTGASPGKALVLLNARSTTAGYTGISDGIWYFHVCAVDSAAVAGSPAVRTVRIDTTDPSAISNLASPTHPLEATWYPNSDPSFSWDASSDGGSGVAGYSYVLDQSADTALDTFTETAGTAASFTGKTDGVWYFHVRAIDVLGNASATATRIVRIDTTPPEAITGLSSPTHPDEATTYPNDSAAFEWAAASDGVSGVAGYSYDFSREGMSYRDPDIDTTTTETSFKSVADGAWRFTVWAVDAAGNTGFERSVIIHIGTPASEVPHLVSPTHPDESAWYADDSPVFAWSPAPPTSQAVAWYQYWIDQQPESYSPDASYVSPVSFALRVDYAVGARPVAIASGDFNKDGNADLVTADYGAAGVTVLLGDGMGYFRVSHDYATGTKPFSLAVTDFDGDANQDLVVANNGDNSVSVLLGNGAGGFGAKTDFAVGSSPKCVAVGDFNRDDRMDVVAANSVNAAGGNCVSVLLGNGKGTFAAKVDYGTGTVPYAVAVGDVNGDGQADLVTANDGAASISVLLGTGDGTFAAASDYSTADNPQSIALADLNADGALDVVTGDFTSDIIIANGRVSVLLGHGDGTFADHTEFQTNTTTNAVAVADLTEDGIPDIVSVSGGNNDRSGAHSLCVLPGNGSGGFGPAKSSLGETVGPHGIALADFNGDGRLDVAVSNFRPAVGPPVYSAGVFINTTSRTVTSSGLADGVYYFHIRAIDSIDNGGPISALAVRIDTTAPETTDNHDGVAHRSFTLILTPSDVMSGVATTEYCLDGGDWVSGTSVTLRCAIRHKRAGVSRGLHTIDYFSTDNAGNVEKVKSCTIWIGL